MILTFDGRKDVSSGEKPNNAVKWTGQFRVADADGNVLEETWQPNGVPRMDVQGARNRAHQLVESLTARLYEQHHLPIRKVAFTLTTR